MDDKRVRCNWCESEFYEKYLRLEDVGNSVIEHCPVCGESGYIMDLEEE